MWGWGFRGIHAHGADSFRSSHKQVPLKSDAEGCVCLVHSFIPSHANKEMIGSRYEPVANPVVAVPCPLLQRGAREKGHLGVFRTSTRRRAGLHQSLLLPPNASSGQQHYSARACPNRIPVRRNVDGALSFLTLRDDFANYLEAFGVGLLRLSG
jgi:hypothetical protein